MKVPNPAAVLAPTTPNTAVVIRAGKYFGASFAKKMLLDTKPITFATGTPTDVRTTRRPSCAILLLYHVESRTDGADVPHVIINVA